MSVTTNTPFGLKYVKSLIGANTQEVLTTYALDPAVISTVSLYQNDPVILSGTGIPGFNCITKAVADTWSTDHVVSAQALVGVVKGFEFIDSRGNPKFQNFFEAGTSIKNGTYVYATVSDDFNVIWEIQANGSLASNKVLAANATITGMGTGDSLNISKTSVDVKTVNLTPGNDTVTLKLGKASTPMLLRIYGLADPVKYPGNAYDAAFPVLLVKINNHAFSAPTFGIIGA